MKICLFIMMFVMVPLETNAAENDVGYLIVEAVVKEEGKRQPRWIYIRGTRSVHVPARKTVISLRPDRYQILHIDFGESIHSGVGTGHIISPRPFRIEAGHVYVFGRIELGKKSDVVTDHELFRRACNAAPNVLSKYPLTMISGNGAHKDFQISCVQTAPENSDSPIEDWKPATAPDLPPDLQ